MHLRLERAASELPADCEAVFRNSAIYERYFQDPGRLELSLRRAVAQGELYLAVSEDGELAGAMRVVGSLFESLSSLVKALRRFLLLPCRCAASESA